jgi:thiol-disulfide isomerase/thioredoxin
MREIPPQNERILILFWASWCGPCKIEMDRFHQSVSDKKIDGGRIIAINPFEDTQVVRKFLKEKFYPFTFVEAPMLTQELDVSVTPTTLLIENGKIISRSSGISVIGIWRAENFLSL